MKTLLSLNTKRLWLRVAFNRHALGLGVHATWFKGWFSLAVGLVVLHIDFIVDNNGTLAFAGWGDDSDEDYPDEDDEDYFYDEQRRKEHL